MYEVGLRTGVFGCLYISISYVLPITARLYTLQKGTVNVAVTWGSIRPLEIQTVDL
jgi:hypothetical protein